METETSELSDRRQREIGKLMEFVNGWKSARRDTERQSRIQSTEERRLRERDFHVRTATGGGEYVDKMLSECKGAITKRISGEMPKLHGEGYELWVKFKRFAIEKGLRNATMKGGEQSIAEYGKVTKNFSR